MTQTIVLTPTTAATQSADFSNTGSAISVCVYCTDWLTNPNAYLGQLTLLRKIGTSYFPICNEDGAVVFLGDMRRDIAISAPGTYAVSKLAGPYNVGVSVDS